VSTATASSFLNTAGKVGRVTISERIEAGRQERRVLARVSRAAWRLEQAERERVWALVSARAEGISSRKLAAAAGLPPSRVHQLVADADLDALDAALADPRAERRRRLAEPDLEFRAFCTRRRLPASSTPQLERAWDAWQSERYRRGETGQRPGYTDNPFRPR
jgi:hypothetical protein